MSLSSGGGFIMLSSCSLGAVSSCDAGLYFPSLRRLRRAITRKTRRAVAPMKRAPPTIGPTIRARSPVRGEA